MEMGECDPRKSRMQDLHKWRVLKTLGKGQFGVAYLIDNCYEDAHMNIAVAKVVTLDFLGEKDRVQAAQEVTLLRSLNHPFIVGYYNHFLAETPIRELTILMEYCDGGELRVKIKGYARTQTLIPEKQIMRWFLQLTLALQYVHRRHVLHRDLKSSNVFLRNQDTDCLIGDFGISRVLEGTIDAAATVVGTPYYMSPEVCRSEPYSYRSDIWALGCILYEMCMLKHAFESENLLGLVYKIVSDNYDPIPKIYSAELSALIDQCLEKSAHLRPDSIDLVTDSFVQKFMTDDLYEKQRACLQQLESDNSRSRDDIAEKHRGDRGVPTTASLQASTSAETIATITPPPPLHTPPTNTAHVTVTTPSTGVGMNSENESPSKRRAGAGGPGFGGAGPRLPLIYTHDGPPPASPYGNQNNGISPVAVPPSPSGNHMPGPSLGKTRASSSMPGTDWTQQQQQSKIPNIPEHKLYFFLIIARVRAGVVRQKVNWLQVFAMFDKTSQGLLNDWVFMRAMTAMHLGLSTREIQEMFKNMSVKEAIALKDFGEYILRIPDQVKEYEEWGYEMLAEMVKQASSTMQGVARGSQVRIQGLKNSPHLNGMEGVCEGWDAITCRWIIRLRTGDLKSIKDANLSSTPDSMGIPQRTTEALKDTSALYRLMCGDDPSGVLDGKRFYQVVQELLPKLTEKERQILFYLSPKNVDGFVDVRGLLSVVGDRSSRRHSTSDDPCSPVSNRGRLGEQQREGSFGGPGGLPSPGPPPPPPMGSPPPTVGIGKSLGMSTGAATVDIALYRLQRRLKEHRCKLSSVLPLFQENKDKIYVDQLLECCSVVPLGLSRVEMQKVFNALQDNTRSVSPEKLEKELEGHSTYSSHEDIAFERIQFVKLIMELRKLDTKDIGRVSPQDFRMVLMQTEGYLTSSELEFLIAITDKDADGNVEYLSFIQRYDARGAAKGNQVEMAKWLPHVNMVRCICYPSIASGTVNEVLHERARRRLKACNVSLPMALRLLMPPDSASTVPIETLAKALGYFPLHLSLAEAAGVAHHITDNQRQISTSLLEKKLSVVCTSLDELTLQVAERLGPNILSSAPFSLGDDFMTQQHFIKCIKGILGAGADLDRVSEDKCLLIADKNAQGRIKWKDFIRHLQSCKGKKQANRNISSLKGDAIAEPHSWRQMRGGPTKKGTRWLCWRSRDAYEV